jgi:hypothetical protein
MPIVNLISVASDPQPNTTNLFKPPDFHKNERIAEMCHETVTTYLQCLHTERQFTRCKDSYKQPRTEKKKQGFFKYLLSSNAPKNPKPHKASKGRSTIDGLCTACSKAARSRQETLNRMERPRYVQSRRYEARNPTEEERRRLHGKWTFRCTRCIAEGRHPSARNRQANGGLCCAYAIQEWEGARGQAHRDITPYNERPPVPPKDKHTLKRVPGNHHLRRGDSTRDARAAASAAARQYNWSQENRDSAALEPHLVREYIALSGSDRAALPAPRRAEPLYEEPQIDWDRWNAAPQTSHGRYPPANPAPDSPLPVRPLRPGRRHPSPPRIRTPAPGRRLTPSPPTPASRDIAEVSPPTSPYRSQSTSPVSPMSTPRWSAAPQDPHPWGNPNAGLNVDVLDDGLNDALRYWGR